MAERVGFEPTEGDTFNGFQDRRFRPLSHLSEFLRESYHIGEVMNPTKRGANQKTDCKRRPKLLTCATHA